MSRLSIATFDDARQAAIGTPRQVLSITLSGSHTESTALTGATGQMLFVRLSADAACDYETGTGAVAVAGTSRSLPAGAIEYVCVKVGDVISAINHA